MNRALPMAAMVLSLAAAAPAGAVETPRPGAADPRIKTVDYDPQDVVRLVGALRTATQIRFSAEETIEHVALGDASGWEVAPETNILFVKPSAPGAPTNLIVTTRTAEGDARHDRPGAAVPVLDQRLQLRVGSPADRGAICRAHARDRIEAARVERA